VIDSLYAVFPMILRTHFSDFASALACNTKILAYFYAFEILPLVLNVAGSKARRLRKVCEHRKQLCVRGTVGSERFIE
jgi:hypothetical protein